MGRCQFQPATSHTFLPCASSMQATTTSQDRCLKPLARPAFSRRCSFCMFLSSPVAAIHLQCTVQVSHLGAQYNTLHSGKTPIGWNIMQVNATNILGASVRYFGLADNQLTGTLPAYLSTSSLPLVSQLSIELQVRGGSTKAAILGLQRMSQNKRHNMLGLAATRSSIPGCMQGNNFSCPIPQDMAYLNVTCQDQPPALVSQQSGVESASSVPDPSTFQTGNATVENASSQQCVPSWARPCCFPSQIPLH